MFLLLLTVFTFHLFICTFLRELPFPTQAIFKPSNFTFSPSSNFFALFIYPSNYEVTEMLIYCYLGIPLNRTGGNLPAFDHFHSQRVTLGTCVAVPAVL